MDGPAHLAESTAANRGLHHTGVYGGKGVEFFSTMDEFAQNGKSLVLAAILEVESAVERRRRRRGYGLPLLPGAVTLATVPLPPFPDTSSSR